MLVKRLIERNWKESFYQMLRIPYYSIEPMKPWMFRGLDSMPERLYLASSLLHSLGSRKILDIGCGNFPIYNYLTPSLYDYITCVDPLLETDLVGPIHTLGLKLEDFEWDRPYDTVILIGLGHTMGKEAFLTLDRMLEYNGVSTFLLEYSSTWVSTIYSNRITKPLPRLGYRKHCLVHTRYLSVGWHRKRRMEVWVRKV